MIGRHWVGRRYCRGSRTCRRSRSKGWRCRRRGRWHGRLSRNIILSIGVHILLQRSWSILVVLFNFCTTGGQTGTGRFCLRNQHQAKEHEWTYPYHSIYFLSQLNQIIAVDKEILWDNSVCNETKGEKEYVVRETSYHYNDTLGCNRYRRIKFHAIALGRWVVGTGEIFVSVVHPLG